MYSNATKILVMRFVDQHGADIVAALTDTNLFFPSCVAQLMVESNYGNYKNQDASYLAVKYNNWAGIKDSSDSRSGEVTLSTKEGETGNQYTINAVFATYPSFKIFLEDYIRILHLPNYINAGVYEAATPEDQIYAIAAGGYSTNKPSEYLRVCRGRIEACRDVYQWGKISNSVSSPTILSQAAGNAVQGGYMQSIIAGIGSTIGTTLAGTNPLKK